MRFASIARQLFTRLVQHMLFAQVAFVILLQAGEFVGGKLVVQCRGLSGSRAVRANSMANPADSCVKSADGQLGDERELFWQLLEMSAAQVTSYDLF